MLSYIKRQLYDLNFTSIDDNELSLKLFTRFILTERRRSFFMMLGGTFLVALLSMLFPLLTGYLIGCTITQSQVSIIWHFAVLFLAASVLLSIFTFIKSTLFSQFQINLMYYIQSLVMRQVFRLPMNFFEQYTAGELNQ